MKKSTEQLPVVEVTPTEITAIVMGENGKVRVVSNGKTIGEQG